MLAEECVEDEWGEMKSQEEQEFRRQAEIEKAQVTWNSERRVFLDTEAVMRLDIYFFLYI